MATEARSCDADHIFRAFSACPQDIQTILLDVRPNKEFKALHIQSAFNVRLSSNEKVLAVSAAALRIEICVHARLVGVGCALPLRSLRIATLAAPDAWEALGATSSMPFGRWYHAQPGS